MLNKSHVKQVLVLIAAIVGTAVHAFANTNAYVLTAIITDPLLPADNSFGYTMGVVGTDKFVITSYERSGLQPGAYLFNSQGVFITTLTNGAHPFHNRGGLAVGGLGSDRVILGAYWNYGPDLSFQVGAAFLVHTNGAMILSITNPTPAPGDNFGLNVAGSSNALLIGAHLDDTGASNAGSAYLFDTNGVLLTTFTNSTPLANENFGSSLAFLGSNRVLIGAAGESSTITNAGAVYLFNTNGDLLTTMTNPSPSSEGFGRALTVVSADKILIGAPGYDYSVSAPNSGAAYLFSTNGALLLTFTNPVPAFGDNFGCTMTTVSPEMVLISAPNFGGGSGSAYLFRADGTLLCSFDDPTPAQNDYYGLSTVALGGDKVFLSAQGDGAVYFFTLQPKAFEVPRLSLTESNGSIHISWPVTVDAYQLFETMTLSPVNWTPVPNAAGTNSSEISVTVEAAGQRFYRLERQ